MRAELKQFSVFPSVVKSDCESEIEIKSFDKRFGFYDDLTYEVKFIPQDVRDVPIDRELTLRGCEKERKTFYVKPVGGVLKLKYFFCDEQEWCIHISCSEYEKYMNPMYKQYNEYWWPLVQAPKRGVDLFIYSLKSDLYERRARLGDLHVHTCVSDGVSDPETVCAFYRKAGRDFLAITDHHVYNTSADAKEKFSFAENFEILCGEEVHNKYVGDFHMVNIGSNYSVNDVYLNERERVEKEVKEISGTVKIPDGVDEWEYINRVWLYREIKKSGGYAIFPHPFWSIGYLHTSVKMSEEIMKNGLCDAFEVIGGTGSVARNNMQVAMYNDLRAQGYDVPIVGSTDAHTVFANSHNMAGTIVFADESGLIRSIDDGYSVAVESVRGESVRVYGKRRLVFYAHFLLENYFPIHDELCFASGSFMEDFAKGDDNAKQLIEGAEKRITDFENNFFGR